MKKMIQNSHLPSYLKKYFWDVDFKNLDYKKYPYFVIERLLEYGDPKSLRWMFKTFSSTKIKQAVEKSRELSPKSAFFGLIFWA